MDKNLNIVFQWDGRFKIFTDFFLTRQKRESLGCFDLCAISLILNVFKVASQHHTTAVNYVSLQSITNTVNYMTQHHVSYFRHALWHNRHTTLVLSLIAYELVQKQPKGYNCY